MKKNLSKKPRSQKRKKQNIVRCLHKLEARLQEKRVRIPSKCKNVLRNLKRNSQKLTHLASKRGQLAGRTRSGYVYINSNIGSFGEDIVKIGLTRRLDPDDRVRELGDASVPFSFDTHAMIYSDDAPTLESALHAEFHDRRVNAANLRKEFFRVGIDEVENAVKRLEPEASFFKDREAQDYNETIARRRAEAEKASTELVNDLPLSI